MSNEVMTYTDVFESAIVWLKQDPERALRMATAVYSRDLNYGDLKEVPEGKIQNLMGVCKAGLPVKQTFGSLYHFKHAMAADPTEPQYAVNAAYGYLLTYQPEKAEKLALEVLENHPDFADACVKLFNSLQHQGRYRDGYEAQLKYINVFDCDFSRMALGLTEFMLSDMKDEEMYRKALVNYRGRYAQLNHSLVNHPLGSPALLKTFLEDQDVWVFLEQGLGDSVMMIPYIQKLAAEIANRVMVVSVDHDSSIDCFESLGCFNKYKNITLIKQANYHGDPASEPQVWMFDLLALGMPSAVCKPQKLRGNPNGKTGIVWRGNPKHPNDFWRSIPFEDMKPFIKQNGKHLLSLQSNLTIEEAEFLKANGVEIDHSIPGYDHLCEVVGNLKQVVTVDTFMSHLAGYMGVPCALLLSTVADWRWGISDVKTPWYTNHSLLRQSKIGDWKALLNDVQRSI